MRYIRYAVKVLAAGATALFILSVFTRFYGYVPLHVPNREHTTDYVWPSNSPWILLTEGLAWGRMDEKGFNNPRTVPNPDIVFMGSSHIEAKNVLQKENACTLLGEKLKGRYQVYNIGMSGHDFSKICHYVPEVLRKYKDRPPAFLIIETASVKVTDNMADDILQGKYRYRPSPKGVFIRLTQSIPVAVFLHRRWENGLKKVFIPQKGKTAPAVCDAPPQPSPQACARVLKFLAKTAAEQGVIVIIFYHPKEMFLGNGAIAFLEKEWVGAFADAAKSNGILFADMSRPFEKMFCEEHHAPHGFVNGKIGRGHLNRYGHRAVAETLAHIITASTGENVPCR